MIMTSINHTPNYGLTQYANNGIDTVSFMGDYNSDMKTIDLKLKALDDKLNQIQSQLNGGNQNA